MHVHRLPGTEQEDHKGCIPTVTIDGVQDRLSKSAIFSTLDLQSGYWQMLVNPEDCAETAFCLGPGLSLYEFNRMPFGLTGAPSSFQRLMDKVLWHLPLLPPMWMAPGE